MLRDTWASCEVITPVGLQLVACMRQQQHRQRYEEQLAEVQRSVPAPLLSYDQLLADIVIVMHFAANLERAGESHRTARGEPVRIVSTTRAWQQLQALAEANAQLVESSLGGSPRDLYHAAHTCRIYLPGGAGVRGAPVWQRLQRVRAAAVVAGSGYWLALATCHLTILCAPTRQPDPIAPRTLLRWLEEADAAYRGCKGYLPQQWLMELTELRQHARPVRRALELVPAPDASLGSLLTSFQGVLDAIGSSTPGQDAYVSPGPEAFSCSACGRGSSEMRKCGGCRQAQYW